MSTEKKPIDPKVVEELEQSKNEVLKRIAEKLKNQIEGCDVEAASHSSHSAGTKTKSGHYSTRTGHSSSH